MEIKQIIKKIQAGELTRDIDETGAGGFWDLAGELQAPEDYDEETQESIYNALWEIVEVLDETDEWECQACMSGVPHDIKNCKDNK